MNQTPPTSTTFGDLFQELGALGAGLGAALMPVFLLSMPGVILCVVLPAILLLLLALPLAVVGAVIAGPPYLVARLLRRRRRRTASPPAGPADAGLRSVRTSGRSRFPELGRS